MSVEECPNCGAPMRDGKCNYCQATELGKGIWNEGKCRNCGAPLHKNLIKDKQNQFVCRYCGWPVRDIPVEDTLVPTRPSPTPDPLPPNSPAATISASSSSDHSILAGFGEMLSLLTIFIFFILIVALIGPISSTFLKSPNITSTTHTIDVPSYVPGPSIMLIGGAFIMGILLTFAILRNRHRRELARQRKLLGTTT